MRKNPTRRAEERLPEIERIKHSGDFSRVFKNPDFRGVCREGKLLAKYNQLDFCRFGITTVRKYGNSIERNYARRVLKEIYRKSKHLFSENLDIVVVLFPGNYNYHDRKRQFMKMLRRAKLVPSDT